MIRFIRQDRGYFQLSQSRKVVEVAHKADTTAADAVEAAQGWGLPALENIAALADWLWLEYEDLDWFADLKQTAAGEHRARLHHYQYRVLRK